MSNAHIRFPRSSLNDWNKNQLEYPDGDLNSIQSDHPSDENRPSPKPAETIISRDSNGFAPLLRHFVAGFGCPESFHRRGGFLCSLFSFFLFLFSFHFYFPSYSLCSVVVWLKSLYIFCQLRSIPNPISLQWRSYRPPTPVR